MTAIAAFLLLSLVILAPFGLIAAMAAGARRNGSLRLRTNQFRISAPMVGQLFSDDADGRRVEHELDAIRARFEAHPVWPSSGATGERR